MKYESFRLDGQLLGVDNCPHCGATHPVLVRLWISDGYIPNASGANHSKWAAYGCTTCGGVVAAKGRTNDGTAYPYVERLFPDAWEPHRSIPPAVATYLRQARSTLSSPDASVVMSASSIDAMLKHFQLTKGSLNARIDEAATAGLLAKNMAEWAHRVRLDANNTRHADLATPHMSKSDAERAFAFADALATYLFVIPSRMPQIEDPPPAKA